MGWFTGFIVFPICSSSSWTGSFETRWMVSTADSIMTIMKNGEIIVRSTLVVNGKGAVERERESVTSLADQHHGLCRRQAGARRAGSCQLVFKSQMAALYNGLRGWIIGRLGLHSFHDGGRLSAGLCWLYQAKPIWSGNWSTAQAWWQGKGDDPKPKR